MGPNKIDQRTGKIFPAQHNISLERLEIEIRIWSLVVICLKVIRAALG
jgi:hypothetical protein